MVWGQVAGAAATWGLNKLFGETGPTAQAQMYMNTQYQKELMDYQNQLQRESRQTYWQDTKQSLLEAGYNPLYGILGNGGAQSMSSSIPSNPAPNLMELKMQKLAMAKQLQEAGAQIANTLADSNLKNEQADTEQTKRDLNIAETGLRIAEKMGQEKNNSWIDHLNIQAIKEGASRIFLNNATANAQQMAANETRYDLEHKMKTQKAEDDWNEKHPKQASISYGLSKWGSAIGAILGGAGIGAGGYAAIKNAHKKPRTKITTINKESYRNKGKNISNFTKYEY